jgi:hypothetical protein
MRAAAVVLVLVLAGIPGARLVCELTCGPHGAGAGRSVAACHDHTPADADVVLTGGTVEPCLSLLGLPTVSPAKSYSLAVDGYSRAADVPPSRGAATTATYLDPPRRSVLPFAPLPLRI